MEDTVDYCRDIEAYLCQKNGGHLVRIVGPAFEKVCEWAEQGIPLKVAYRGIDRCVERASAKGGRRRPMRIEFCEADVLDAFDDWRRALGVTTQVAESAEGGGEWDSGGSARKGSLAAHVERSVSRLLAARSARPDPTFDALITKITADLDEIATTARSARGEARATLLARLAALDAELIAAARANVDLSTAAALEREVDAELAGFSGRMAPEALERARQLGFQRLLRESLNLPVLSFE